MFETDVALTQHVSMKDSAAAGRKKCKRKTNTIRLNYAEYHSSDS